MHIRTHLGERFRKFTIKNNDEIWNYAPKTAKWQKIDYKVCAGRPKSWPKTLILNFPVSTGSHIPFNKLRGRLLEVFSQNNDQIKVIFQKLPKSAKSGKNLPI